MVMNAQIDQYISSTLKSLLKELIEIPEMGYAID